MNFRPTVQLAPAEHRRETTHENPDQQHKDESAGPDRAQATNGRLNHWEGAAAFCLLLAWLLLFGGGITVDTEPYRSVISAAGVAALKGGGGSASGPASASSASAEIESGSRSIGVLTAWAVVVTCFLPLNLAWLCVAASTLGAFGSIANLSVDGSGSVHAMDSSNPYLSAVLRGFFVFLFMMSGLLLLDDAPFSNAGPAQYIRLAGFLSLFSFIVSYQPRLFSALVVSAFQRIQVRGGDESAEQEGDKGNETLRATVDVGVAVESESNQPRRSTDRGA